MNPNKQKTPAVETLRPRHITGCHLTKARKSATAMKQGMVKYAVHGRQGEQNLKTNSMRSNPSNETRLEISITHYKICRQAGTNQNRWCRPGKEYRAPANRGKGAAQGGEPNVP